MWNNIKVGIWRSGCIFEILRDNKARSTLCSASQLPSSLTSGKFNPSLDLVRVKGYPPKPKFHKKPANFLCWPRNRSMLRKLREDQGSYWPRFCCFTQLETMKRTRNPEQTPGKIKNITDIWLWYIAVIQNTKQIFITACPANMQSDTPAFTYLNPLLARHSTVKRFSKLLVRKIVYITEHLPLFLSRGP